MRITVFDYGAGNLHSLAKAFARKDIDVRTVPDPVKATDTDVLVLPGVGAFGPAAARLGPGADTVRSAIAAGLPCIGICLGMQLMFDESAEGAGSGLGLFHGCVRRLAGHRIPQMGWNAVTDTSDGLFERAGLRDAYYANSYVCAPQDDGHVIAWTTYERDRFPAAVRAGRMLGVQFHPEKSSGPGIRFLHMFLDEVCA